MKLNLGCGQDLRAGHLNVDLWVGEMPDGPAPTMRFDLSKEEWPWKNDSIEEVLMLDFLEHLPYRQTFMKLEQVWNILRVGGSVIIQVPDFNECARAIIRAFPFLCNCCGYEFSGEHCIDEGKCPQCRYSIGKISENAIHRLYGGQDYQGNTHYNAFTKDSLREVLKTAGFVDISFIDEEHQRKNWNMKVIARKGDGDLSWEN